jgi:hypothetical protein
MPKLSVVNDRANPPILIESKLTKSPKGFSSNSYLDPTDKACFGVEDLTPLEKGHVYEYLQVRVALVEIHMPLRVMDKELADALSRSKFPSFRSIKETVRVHRNPRDSAKKLNSCVRDFTLNHADFQRFKNLGETNGYVLENLSVPLDEMTRQIESLSCFSNKEIHERLSRCRSRTAGKEISLEEALTELKEIEQQLGVFRLAHKALLKSLDRLSAEFGRDADKASVDYEYRSRSSLFQQTKELDLSRAYAECVHNASEGDNAARPGYLASLEWELGRLKTFFPALKHLQVTGETAFISMSGVKILLGPDKLWIEGDIAALQPYTSGVDVKSKETRSRFSGILFQEET